MRLLGPDANEQSLVVGFVAGTALGLRVVLRRRLLIALCVGKFINLLNYCISVY
jgi:hypothetical protein